MRIIGLTGSIACGKSAVSAFLTSRGFPVVDGDRLSRELTAPGSPVLEALRRTFGDGFFSEDGSLNRRCLGQLVFSDAGARAKLDDLMAPYLISLTCRRLDEIRASGAPLCFLEMPLLYEKKYDRLCDTVWVVWVPESVQLSRLMARDGFSRDEAMNRIRSVLSSDEKAALADRVIDNSGSAEQTAGIVSDLLADELRAAEKAPRSRRTRSSVPESPSYLEYIPDSSSGTSYMSPAPAPEGFARPEAAVRTRKNPRKAAWRMPVWLKSSLIAATVLVLAGSASLFMMNAYLQNCERTHISEQESIDFNYPLSYRDLIEEYAGEFNLSPAYVSAIIRNESSFNKDAQSGAGARGLMQLMPDTANWIAGKLQVSGFSFERMITIPEMNIRFGCWYLNYLSRLFRGDPVAVTAAYHAGQGQVKIWLSDLNISEDGYSLPLSALPDGPTKNYARRVTRDYGIYQEKYFSVDQLSADSDSTDSGVSGFSGDR